MNQWNYPTAMTIGDGSLCSLPSACATHNIRHPLLVTDPGILALPMCEQVIALCQEAGLALGVFSHVKSNPTGENVEQGVKAYQSGGHDGIIVLGGGSALDCGKAIALIAGQSHSLWDFEDVGDNWTRADVDKIAPVIAIPTTAGTGSEVGRASVITDEDARRKKIIFHPHMLPVQVILDPRTTIGLPPHITAATGMDALSHSLEALCAPGYHPMAEGIAIEGIRLVRDYLPVVYQDGDNINGRMQMLVASSMGATAFQKGLGAMHALAHSLGALYDKHHGMLNAILMPYVIAENRHHIDEKMQRLGRYLGFGDKGTDAVLDWILALRVELAIPHTLAEIGLNDADASRIGLMSVVDPSAGGNPILLSAAQYSQLYLKALEGKGL